MNSSFYIDMDIRSVLAVGGDDRRDFLQSIVTNDISLAHNETAIYACLLSPQGKFLHDFIVIDDAANERFLLLCENARRADLIRRLTIYKLRSKIKLEDLADKYKLSFLWGASALGIADPRLAGFGRWLLTKPGQVVQTNAQKMDVHDYHRYRILLGIPEGSLDMEPDKATLLDNNIDELQGISWTKGCYTGQEVTARMRYRALVRKKLVTVKSESGSLPPKGTVITLNGSAIGDMKSVESDIGLALLKLPVEGRLEAAGISLVIQNK